MNECDVKRLDELLTVAQVARRFRCRSETVRRWLQAGKLPAIVTPGGVYRIRASDLEQLLRPAGRSE